MTTGASRSDQSFTLFEDSELSSEYEFVATPAESEYDVKSLPHRQKGTPDYPPDVQVKIHEAPEKDGILVSVKPPRTPEGLKHTPCDIVLTVDVSGSMSAEAPPPVANPDDAERNGLTVLDLVKHAARTILETLDDTDRLAIVTFSTEAKTVQRLLPMTAENKALALRNINSLRPESMTNLWHGILESIKVFENDERSNCVPAIMILTDGLPNHMCPSQGYVKKLRGYELPASLHTFGFGFSLRSGLLKSIAEIGGGNYAFIPDSGMLGTVFIHAVANLQATFATRVSLALTTSHELTLVESMGAYVSRTSSAMEVEPDFEEEFTVQVKTSRSFRGARSPKASTNTLTLDLDDILYGQSRDIFLKYRHKSLSAQKPTIAYRLMGRPVDGSLLDVIAERVTCTEPLRPTTIVYHRSRAEICNLLSSMFPLNTFEEHQATVEEALAELHAKVESLASRIQTQANGDAAILSLIDDLVGNEPSGQIRLAVSNIDYFERWGKHYLLSILNAHQKQVCNSFKDNGPLLYGIASPLFIQCRDALDKAFDHLPPPTPSRPPRDKRGQQRTTRVDMRKYRCRDNPCFAGSCRVRMENGSQLQVKSLRRGMRVQTRRGVAGVAAVMATKVEAAPLCVIGDLTITPWHPIYTDNGWDFPANVAERSELYDGVIYSVLLERNDNAEAHTMEVEGQWATTLGHGITQATDDIRAHEFLGDYNKVGASLGGLSIDSEGVLQCGGINRSSKTGLACGFQPFPDLGLSECVALLSDVRPVVEVV